MTVIKEAFGKNKEGQAIHKYTLINDSGFNVEVIDYGATVTRINVPQGENKPPVDVVLGFDDVEGYMSEENPYFGATVGRVANRTKPTKFNFDNTEVSLSQNRGDCHLHGGIKGFDKVMWTAKIEGDKVVMSYVSKDGEEGYPGTVTAVTTFEITEDNALNITFKAVTDKPTIVNLTNHSYFNLAGHESGSEELLKHELEIYGNQITKLNLELVATGVKMDVAGTGYDFTSRKILGDAMNCIAEVGFDVNYCLTPESDDLKKAAVVSYKPNGVTMEVYTTAPGVQFYTSNFIDKIIGKGGAVYTKHSALCLETQNFPNAVNVKSFPSVNLLPGSEYVHKAVYKFIKEK